MTHSQDAVERFMRRLTAQNPSQPQFLQAVREVLVSIMPIVIDNPEYEHLAILERIVEPERVVVFRVPWVDDDGRVQVNRGFRVEMNNALGPFKGGLRFHPSVNLSIMKFLAFEQVFKNSLTTLPLGGGKGGADFDPKGKTDQEVMRFCQAFMRELFRHIGPDTDVPAGDIGVGPREIGYLFGQYKKLTNTFTGVLTGKGLGWGGSRIRPEAAGYGAVYFAQEMLAREGRGLEGARVCVSGAGNAAQFTVAKLIDLGARVLTMCDSSGTVVDPSGIDGEKLAWIQALKNERRGRLAEYAEAFPDVEYLDGRFPWCVPCDLAFPAATENEIDGAAARQLVDQGCTAVVEVANMPTDPDGVDVFMEAGLLFAPGKAANAGGVATSSLEMSQNAMHLTWTAEEVDRRLREVMQSIHAACVQAGRRDDGTVDYVRGANVAGFVKVGEAMRDQGVV